MSNGLHINNKCSFTLPHITYHIPYTYTLSLTLFLHCCRSLPLLTPLPLPCRLNLALGGDQLPPVPLARVVHSVCADRAALGGSALQVPLLLGTQLRRK